MNLKGNDVERGEENMKDMLKRTAIISMLTSIVFAILGIVMITNPETTIAIVVSVLGITIIVIGLEKIISYLVLKESKDFYNHELIYGIIAILFGILIMTQSNMFATIVKIIIGIWIAYAGLLKINFAFKLKNAKLKSWTVVMVLSTISLLAGILVMFINTSSIVIITAIVMIVYAVSNLIDEIIFIRNIDKVIK